MVGRAVQPLGVVTSLSYDAIMTRLLENLSGPEIDERITESSVIIQPIGAVEQQRAPSFLSPSIM